MKFFPFIILLNFIIRLRFPKNRPLSSIIIQRYGQEGRCAFRKFENVDRKFKKVNCDLYFLDTCLTNNLTPKFLHFKLYSRHLNNEDDYKRMQKQLLLSEIESKRKLEAELLTERSVCFDLLQRICSILDFNHLVSQVDKFLT